MKKLISFAMIFTLFFQPAALYAGKTYSSGGSTRSSSPSTKSSSPSTRSPSPSPSKPSGKSYSSGSSKPSSNSSSSSSSSPSSSRKPSGSGISSALSSSAKKEESRIKYQAATTPKPTYKTSTGQSKPVQANSPQVSTVRKSVTHEKYITYENRSSSFYGSHYGHPVYYNDFFSPFLMGWLMSDALSSHDRALWMYHHQSDMDSARYNELLKKDARLQSEIDQLKSQNIQRDEGYVPSQMKDNPDLMFNKDFVDASYNEEATEEDSGNLEGVGMVLLYILLGFIALFVLFVFVHFLFMKEYQ